MKFKFTSQEIEDLKIFIKSYSRATTNAERKKFRGKMRGVGFYVSEFGIDNIDIGKFQSLLRSGKIQIIKKSPTNVAFNSPAKTSKDQQDNFIAITEIENRLCQGKFQRVKVLEKSLNLNCPGFYCIRLREGSQLPERYQKHLRDRDHGIIYLGKAEGQTLRKRLLKQELRAEGHGTFFRSIGAVLGFTPEIGSLLAYKNKNNYKFPTKDEEKIIKWINKNLEVSCLPFSGDFSIENNLIRKHTPLLNATHNPLKLKELIEDKARCREIANKNN